MASHISLLFCLLGIFSTFASGQSIASWNTTAYANSSSTGWSSTSSSSFISTTISTTDSTTVWNNTSSAVTSNAVTAIATPSVSTPVFAPNGTFISSSSGLSSLSISSGDNSFTNNSTTVISTTSDALSTNTPPANISVSSAGTLDTGSSASSTETPSNATIPVGISPSDTSSTDSTSTVSATGPESSISTSASSGTSSATSDVSATTTTTADPGSITSLPTVTSTTASSETSDAPPVTTITASSASTQSVSTIDGVTTNTHITTTDSEGHETIVPVLWGCPFCGSGGIELFGFGPGPGVFVWPPVPPFSGLPPVTLNNNNDPSIEPTTRKPSASQSSTVSSESGSCTSSSTTEKLYVTCHETTTSGSGGLVTATASCETSTLTITGCDLTATATTTTATATATCWTYSIESSDLPDEGTDSGDTSETKKRSIAGRIEYEVKELTSSNPAQVLAKRAGGITTFGTCDITKEVKYPAWPSAAELQNNRNAAKVSSDQYWYRVKPGECGALASLYHDATFLRKPAVNEVNADHVFEKAIPKQFLDTVFATENGDQCRLFNQLFVDQTDGNFPDSFKPAQGDPNAANQIRLQSLFNRVPNKVNFYFVGLDRQVNALKGTLFNPKLDGIAMPKSSGSDADVKKNLDLWNRIGMVIDFLKMDVVQRVFAQGQSEVYTAFVKFDELWSGCAEPINFSQKYQEYIKGLLQDNIASIQAHASAVSSSLVQYATTTVDNKPDELNSYGNAIRALEKAYAPGNLAFPTDPLLVFPETTAGIKKRQAACTLSAAPSTATSVDASTTAEPTTPSGAAASASSASAASASSASAASVSSESVASVSSASAASVSSASAASVSSESAASAASASSASVASAAAASSASAAAAVPTGDCYLWDYASLAYSIQVTPINNWTGDDGGSLKSEEKGCGALTSWEFGSWSNGTQWATFNLPTLIKAGCVERAIKSAGGPGGLKCQGMGFFDGFIQEDGSIGETVAEMPDDIDSGVGIGGFGGNKVFAAAKVADDGEDTGSTLSGPHGLPPAPEPTTGMLPLAVPE